MQPQTDMMFMRLQILGSGYDWRWETAISIMLVPLAEIKFTSALGQITASYLSSKYLYLSNLCKCMYVCM